MHRKIKCALLTGILSILCLPRAHAEPEIDLSKINLPEGFEVSLYADDVPNARSLTMGDKGTLFVGTRSGDRTIYAVVDKNNDGKADKTYTIAEKLRSPNGVAFRDGALYVAEINRITRYDNIEDNLRKVPEPVVIYDKLPTEGHHGWKYLEFGPDGKLYFNVGAPCNVCDSTDEDERFATIMRINADGSDPEIYARGIRNSVGFDWHPDDGALWFTDNNPDDMGDDRPACELNRVTEQDQHFGYPHCHGRGVEDPDFGGDTSCDDFVAPALALGAHVAPLGIKFYTGTQFPEEYRKALFIAEHGSWNRSMPQGYRVNVVRPDKDGAIFGFEVFADGWLERGKAWGRPVDVLVLDDGSLLVSDDQLGVVYKFTYTG